MSDDLQKEREQEIIRFMILTFEQILRKSPTTVHADIALCCIDPATILNNMEVEK